MVGANAVVVAKNIQAIGPESASMLVTLLAWLKVSAGGAALAVLVVVESENWRCKHGATKDWPALALPAALGAIAAWGLLS